MNERIAEVISDLEYVLGEHARKPFTDPQTLIIVIRLVVTRLSHINEG